ncbi:MAG: ECF-type sigma factor [Pseudomonadota bacterium]
MSDPKGELTQLLRRWSDGDTDSRDRLMEGVYQELKQIARRHMARETNKGVLQPTALVHEAYLKLANVNQVDWQDRVHFIAVAARAMRQVLVDRGRRRSALRRDFGHRVTLVTNLEGVQTNIDLMELDQALERLEAIDERQVRVVELRFFGGMTIPEIALVMDRSEATVSRSWRAARAWLFNHLEM